MAHTQTLMTRPAVLGLGLKEILSLAGIAGPVVLVIVNYIVALSTPGYSLIKDSISSLAWAPLGCVQTVGFVVIGLLTELFAADLFFSIRGVRGFRFVVVLIVLSGFGLILIGIFHADPDNGLHTIQGAIHGVMAKIVFWSIPIAIFLIAPSLRKDHYWKPLFVYSLAAAIVATVLLISNIWIPEDSKFGLLERVLVADEILWLEIVAIWLFRLTLRMRENIPSGLGEESLNKYRRIT